MGLKNRKIITKLTYGNDIKIKEEGVYIKDNEFLTDDYHLDLNRAYEEIEFLYYTYGKEDNENLTNDAIKLKKDILDFIYRVKLL